ncbi:MAG TPA: NADH-quinone oxidoreductase subunit B family protein [Dehalococcoidales bacterium]|nr:NADH-quinone oxidoreductase subunit B family protein [Dehalococcoidales bacterium]
MAIDSGKEYIPSNYSDTQLDKIEGQEYEQVKAESQGIITDPDQWLLETELKENILLTTVDAVINWGQRSSLWTAICFPACCAFEFIAANGPRFDMSRFGMEILRASPRQADLMITAGTLTWKMAPTVKRIYNQMAEPKWVIAMGACGISGGIFRSSYNVVPGYNHIVPVDVYVPGCPPRPESLIYGIQMLQKKIAKKSIFHKDSK